MNEREHSILSGFTVAWIVGAVVVVAIVIGYAAYERQQHYRAQAEVVRLKANAVDVNKQADELAVVAGRMRAERDALNAKLRAAEERLTKFARMRVLGLQPAQNVEFPLRQKSMLSRDGFYLGIVHGSGPGGTTTPPAAKPRAELLPRSAGWSTHAPLITDGPTIGLPPQSGQGALNVSAQHGPTTSGIRERTDAESRWLHFAGICERDGGRVMEVLGGWLCKPDCAGQAGQNFAPCPGWQRVSAEFQAGDGGGSTADAPAAAESGAAAASCK